MKKLQFFKKIFKIYKPTEEIMYTTIDLLKKSMKASANDAKYEVLDLNNCNMFSPDDFFCAKQFLKNNAIVVGAWIQGKPAGYAAVVLKGGKGIYFKVKHADVYIDGVYVFEEFRRRGLASSLVNEVMRKAENMCNTEIICICVRPDNIPAKIMYQKMGFQTRRTVTFVKKWFMKFPYYSV